MPTSDTKGRVNLRQIGYAVEYKEVNGAKVYSLHLDQARADQAIVERHGLHRHNLLIVADDEAPAPQAKWPFN